MEYLLLKYAHLLAFVYWLGGDLGTFFGSRAVIRTDIGPEARAVALKIMLACDQGPKLAMPLILPLGLQMTNLLGITSLPLWVVVVMWAVAAVWTANVFYLYFSSNAEAKRKVTQFDFALRVVVVSAVVIYAVAGLLEPALIRAEWASWKLLVFASLVVFGLCIRVALKPFTPAFVRLMSDGPSPEVNTQLTRSLKLAKPWVWGIWAGLFVNAAIGLHLLNGNVWWLALVIAVPLVLTLQARRRYA